MWSQLLAWYALLCPYLSPVETAEPAHPCRQPGAECPAARSAVAYFDPVHAHGSLSLHSLTQDTRFAGPGYATRSCSTTTVAAPAAPFVLVEHDDARGFRAASFRACGTLGYKGNVRAIATDTGTATWEAKTYGKVLPRFPSQSDLGNGDMCRCHQRRRYSHRSCNRQLLRQRHRPWHHSCQRSSKIHIMPVFDGSRSCSACRKLSSGSLVLTSRGRGSLYRFRPLFWIGHCGVGGGGTRILCSWPRPAQRLHCRASRRPVPEHRVRPSRLICWHFWSFISLPPY